MIANNITGYATKEELSGLAESMQKKWKIPLLLLDLALQVKSKEIDRQSPVAPVAADTVRQPVSPTARILIIYAFLEPLKYLINSLVDDGFEVNAFPYPEGLEKSREADLVISDDHLPNTEYDHSYIRKQTNAPIIILGSNPGTEVWDKAVNTGADAYLNRTGPRKETIARMKAILRRYQVQHKAKGTNDAQQ